LIQDLLQQQPADRKIGVGKILSPRSELFGNTVSPTPQPSNAAWFRISNPLSERIPQRNVPAPRVLDVFPIPLSTRYAINTNTASGNNRATLPHYPASFWKKILTLWITVFDVVMFPRFATSRAAKDGRLSKALASNPVPSAGHSAQ
jgi:hypothetical protein